MQHRSLKFADHLVPRPKPGGIDVVTMLEHFAIITYAIDPARFAGLIPDHFRLQTVTIDGQPKALLSVVPFMDRDFRLAAFPSPKARMGQTNYRIYVEDTATGESVVWFLGTVLDSWSVTVPRHVWKLPWHHGRIHFACELDAETGRYRRYEMKTASAWAPAEVTLVQDGTEPGHLPGFADDETGLVFLTHPLTGYYYRRDGKIGTYRVWHDRIAVTPASLQSAYFGLLDRLGLASRDEQQHPHSVLVTPSTEFVIYLPPVAVDGATASAPPAQSGA